MLKVLLENSQKEMEMLWKLEEEMLVIQWQSLSTTVLCSAVKSRLHKWWNWTLTEEISKQSIKSVSIFYDSGSKIQNKKYKLGKYC